MFDGTPDEISNKTRPTVASGRGWQSGEGQESGCSALAAATSTSIGGERITVPRHAPIEG